MYSEKISVAKRYLIDSKYCFAIMVISVGFGYNVWMNTELFELFLMKQKQRLVSRGSLPAKMSFCHFSSCETFLLRFHPSTLLLQTIPTGILINSNTLYFELHQTRCMVQLWFGENYKGLSWEYDFSRFTWWITFATTSCSSTLESIEYNKQ
jgi:hypothetical protein